MKFRDLSDHALAELAKRFDERKRATTLGVGWGQFIDGSASHTQVGPYGTAAGLISIALSRGPDPVVESAASDLVNQWEQYKIHNPDHLKLFCQNLRLAWVYLALSLAGPKAQSAADEIYRELIKRQIFGGNWGDWWIDDARHDTVPKRFVTALIYFCLSSTRGSTPQAKSWANAQTPLPLVSYGYPTIEVMFHSLAVLTNADSVKTKKTFRRELKGRAWRQLAHSRENAAYFYDFQYLDAGSTVTDGREYFIVPLRLVAVILGSNETAPPLLKAATLSTISSAIGTMRIQQGIYKEAEGARASSLNQAWASIAIREASLMTAPRSGNLLWLLLKDRNAPSMDRYFPFATVCLATVLAAFSPNDPSSKAVVALCLLAIGWIYSPKISRLLNRS